MNNKGQSLVIFVIAIPLIFILAVFVFDIANVYSEKSELDNLAYDALYYKFTSHKTIDSAKQLVYENDKSARIDELTEDTICLSKDTEPLFGGVLGYEKFTIKTCYEAHIFNSILRVEKRDD